MTTLIVLLSYLAVGLVHAGILTYIRRDRIAAVQTAMKRELAGADQSDPWGVDDLAKKARLAAFVAIALGWPVSAGFLIRSKVRKA